MEQIVQHFFVIFLPLFCVLFVSVFVWFALVSRLYKLLKLGHPQKYDQMGSLTLFWNNSPKSAWVLMKFLMRKEYRELRDPKLLMHGDIMFWFFVAYGVVFSLMFISVLLMTMYVGSHVSP